MLIACARPAMQLMQPLDVLLQSFWRSGARLYAYIGTAVQLQQPSEVAATLSKHTSNYKIVTSRVDGDAFRRRTKLVNTIIRRRTQPLEPPHKIPERSPAHLRLQRLGRAEVIAGIQ